MQDLDEMFRDFLDRREGAPEPQRPRGGTSLGSGFIIDPAGYIVTNNHVIEDADEIMVLTHDNEELKATIVGRDEKTDLALLKVEAEQAAALRELGRFRRAAHRRLGDGDRQSVRPRRHGDRGHRLGAPARHQFRPV